MSTPYSPLPAAPPKVPGYSCEHCGVLVAKVHRMLCGERYVHPWSMSIFCFPKKLDFWHRAKPYEQRR